MQCQTEMALAPDMYMHPSNLKPLPFSLPLPRATLRLFTLTCCSCYSCCSTLFSWMNVSLTSWVCGCECRCVCVRCCCCCCRGVYFSCCCSFIAAFVSIFRFVFDCLLKGAACAYATLFALFLSLAHGHGHIRAQSWSMPATLANKSASVATLCRNDAVIHRPIIQRVIRIKWIVNYISAALEPSSHSRIWMRMWYWCWCWWWCWCPECDGNGESYSRVFKYLPH